MIETNSEWLRKEPFTLALSAGFFGFFAHAGFVCALERKNLFPKRIVGVSAGALTGALWASGVGALELKTLLLSLNRNEFWDPAFPLGGILKGKKFAHKLHSILERRGVGEFHHCPIALTIVVFDLLRRRTKLISEGAIEPAVRASCALPLFFRPVRIGFQLYLDGGIGDRFGVSALKKGERTAFHILLGSSTRLGPTGIGEIEERSFNNWNFFQVHNLPKVGPFSLEHGQRALEMVEMRTLEWLEEPCNEFSQESI